MDDSKIDILRGYLAGGAKNIVILSHTNPDGDAIGSSLALAHVVRSLGHAVSCIVPNRYPSFLDWMSGIDGILIFKEKPQEALAAVDAADIIFCLDFNSLDRLEALGEHIVANTSARRVLIDHHLSPPEQEYSLVFSEPQSCSTAYLVYRVVERLTGLETIDKASAESLYVGIMTDTGNFSFSFLTPDLFRAVAVLLEKGVDIPQVNSSVYNSYNEGRVRLLGYVLMKKMTMIEDGTVAYIDLKENELRRYDFHVGDSEGFVNYPLSIASVRMSAMFLQTHKFIRISLRSRGGVDVSEFASRYFEGGGHKNASGGKSYDSMEKTIERFKAAVREFFAKG